MVMMIGLVPVFVGATVSKDRRLEEDDKDLSARGRSPLDVL